VTEHGQYLVSFHAHLFQCAINELTTFVMTYEIKGLEVAVASAILLTIQLTLFS